MTALGTHILDLGVQGKLEQATATYREAITQEPQFPEAYNNLGNALRCAPA